MLPIGLFLEDKRNLHVQASRTRPNPPSFTSVSASDYGGVGGGILCHHGNVVSNRTTAVIMTRLYIRDPLFFSESVFYYRGTWQYDLIDEVFVIGG